MSRASQEEIDRAEARAAELHALWQRFESQAAFHERHQHSDADRYRRTADAGKLDYEAAVRDLRRAQGLL